MVVRLVSFKSSLGLPITQACATSDIEYGMYSNSFNDRKARVHVEVDKNLEIAYGYCYVVTDVEPITDKIVNNSSFKYRSYMKSKGIIYSGYGSAPQLVNTSLITRLKNLRLGLITRNSQLGPVGVYANAILLGDNDIDSHYKSIYGQVGVAALFAISGMHIAIIYSLLLYYMSKFHIVDTSANKLALVILIVYSILAGSSVAINRALMMIGIKLIFGYKSSSCLGISSIISIVWNPFNLLNKGYILSYVVTFVIITLPRSLYQNNSFAIVRFGYLIYLIALPFSYSFNYTVNLLSPIATLIITPLITFGLMPLSFILTIWPIRFIVQITNLVINIINSLAQVFNLFTITSGHISIVMWCAYLGLLYLLVVTDKKRLGIKGLIIWFVVVSLDVDLYPKVTFIDVGQGDGALVEYDGYNIMFDVGQKPKEVWKELRYQGVSELDAVFISHAHADHYGALAEVANYIKIDKVYELTGNQIVNNSIGLDKYYNGPVIEIIPYLGSDDNNRELTVRLNLNGVSFLFPGDVEDESENYLVNNYCQQIDSDVLKVPHHGSKTSSSQSFLDCVSPEVAIISSGVGNRYGHPSAEVVSRYEQFCQVYDTQFDGEIEMVVRPQGLTIKKKSAKKRT